MLWCWKFVWGALCWTASVTTLSPVLSRSTVGPRGRERPAHRLYQFASGHRNAPSRRSAGSRQPTARRCQWAGGGRRGRIGGGCSLYWLPQGQWGRGSRSSQLTRRRDCGETSTSPFRHYLPPTSSLQHLTKWSWARAQWFKVDTICHVGLFNYHIHDRFTNEVCDTTTCIEMRGCTTQIIYWW